MSSGANNIVMGVGYQRGSGECIGDGRVRG